VTEVAFTLMEDTVAACAVSTAKKRDTKRVRRIMIAPPVSRMAIVA
jgi:hypothetical protein